MSALEVGGPLVLKKMLDIIMDVDGSAICALIQNLPVLRMKDVPGENVGTVVSSLKGAFMLIQNCTMLPIDIIRLMNDTMCSADCDEFKVFHADGVF